jgi:hypothetical protein
MPPEPYVSARVIAEHLDIQSRQVLAMTRAGKLPAHPIDPAATRKQWRYRLSEVDAAIGGDRKPSNDSGIAQNAACPDNNSGSPRSRRG